MDKTVWFCETERFGYTLQVIGRTKEEAREANKGICKSL